MTITNPIAKSKIPSILPQIITLLENAKKQVVQTVNTTMVCTYFEIGKIIVEDEQDGNIRAEYKKETLKNLSITLTKQFGKGFSVRNLERMRLFYTEYSKTTTLSTISNPLHLKSKNISPSKIEVPMKLENKTFFTLSWSHYVFLLQMNTQEREFYEKESQINQWSLRELKRQYNSSLYERVVLSRDKNGVLDDNLQKYHSPEAPNDVLKDPYVLEFLGLEESKKYSESELEQKIIDNLEHFLLEIGNWERVCVYRETKTIHL